MKFDHISFHTIRNWLLIVVSFLLVNGSAFAMEKNDTHSKMHIDHSSTPSKQHVHQVTTEAKHAADQVGVDEKLGQLIPLELTFQDENGQNLKLKDFVNQPTLILPIFYYCPATCSLMLANLSNALNRINAIPGKEFRVIAFSFNDEETPSNAKKSKANYLKILKKDFPEAEWKYITGNTSSIKSLTQAIGFKFIKTGKHQFVHPNVLIVTASGGKIIRYLYGPDFLPFDIGMALAEAEKGTPGISIKKVLSYCFAYDSQGKRYVFRTFRILGTFILIILGVFFIWVSRKKR